MYPLKKLVCIFPWGVILKCFQLCSCFAWCLFACLLGQDEYGKYLCCLMCCSLNNIAYIPWSNSLIWTDFQATWLDKTQKSLANFQPVCSPTNLRQNLWVFLLVALWGAAHFEYWRAIFIMIFLIFFWYWHCWSKSVPATCVLGKAWYGRRKNVWAESPVLKKQVFSIGKHFFFFLYNFCGCCYCKLPLVLKVWFIGIFQSLTLEASLHAENHTQIYIAFLKACVSFSITSVFINTFESALPFIM